MTYVDIFRPRTKLAPVPADLIDLAQQQIESVIGLQDPYAYTEEVPEETTPGPFGMSQDDIAALTPSTDVPVDVPPPDLDLPEPVADESSFGLTSYFGDVSADPFGDNTSTPESLPDAFKISKALDGVRGVVRPGFAALSKFGAPALDYDPKQAELNNMLRRLIRGMQ